MFTLNGSIFENLIMNGSLVDGNNCQFIRCDLKAGGLTNIGNSRFHGCLIGGSNSFKDGESSSFDQCYSDKSIPVTFSFGNPANPTVAHFSEFKGELTVSDMSNNAIIHISGDGLLTVDSSCSQAVVKLAGNIKIVDDGVSTDIFDNRLETSSDTQNILDAIADSETNLSTAISSVPENLLDTVLDGAATVRTMFKKTLAYCSGTVVRVGNNYKYSNFDNTADELEFEVTVTPGGHTRSRL